MRILLVDDDTGALQALMAIVKTIPGHDVRCAATAQKAVEHAAALGGCDLLITDVVMEPTDGFTLRAELQAQCPAMKVIFVSAYDLSDYAEQIAGAHALSKPLDADVLRKLIVAAAAPPVPVATAVPRAVAQARQPTIPQAVPVAAVAAPPAVDDPLIGVQLGDYRVQQLIGRGVWGSVYLAIQLSVNRPVGLKVLDPEYARDENAHAQFLADARAKAAVQHPYIVSVFEADERSGLVFYTHEYQEGATLHDLIERGQKINEKTALHVMKVVSEGLNYLWTHDLFHGPLDATGVRLGKDGIPRLANLAASTPDETVTQKGEVFELCTMIHQLMPPNAMSPGLRALLGRMSAGPTAIASWPPVIQAVKALEPKIVPLEAAKIKAADAAAVRAMSAAKQAQKRAFYISIVTLTVLAVVVAGVAYFLLSSNKRDLTQQVSIPAGSYTVGPPESPAKIDLGAFDIDKYEVTIGDYAEFIRFLKANPGRSKEFDHPRTPGIAGTYQHVTDAVERLILNANLRRGTVFRQPAKKGAPEDPGASVDLNCPIVMITWWDAYAYAKWKNRDLPTEEEWEVAARGPGAFKYPWGDGLILSNFNSNEGYVAMAPGNTKTPDGFSYWNPVDKMKGDLSPFKVAGMAGNVSEWVYRREQSKEIPLVKGASFAGPPIPMYERVLTLPAEDCHIVWPAAQKPPGARIAGERYYVGDNINPGTRTLYIGFRTVRRK